MTSNKLINEMNYSIWFGGEKILSRKYTEYMSLLSESGGYDSDYDSEDEETEEKNVVDFYFDEILKDKSGKYFFISKRRVKWFLLKKVHLEDITLTYKKLWNLDVKKKLLKELEELSSSFEIDEGQLEVMEEESIKINILDAIKIFMIRLKKSNLKKYRKGIREELDLSYRWKGYERMTDEKADKFINYAYYGIRTDKNNPNIDYIYTKEWCSDYMVGEMVDIFTFKIVVYDLLLLNNHNETFDSYYDSSPMSDLKEVVAEYLLMQQHLIESILGKKESNNLLRIRNRLEKYSRNMVTMFQIYRIFHVL